MGLDIGNDRIKNLNQLDAALLGVEQTKGLLDEQQLSAVAKRVAPGLKSDFQRLLETKYCDQVTTGAMHRALAEVPVRDPMAGLQMPVGKSINQMAKDLDGLTRLPRYDELGPAVKNWDLAPFLAIEDPIARGAALQILRQLSDSAVGIEDPYALGFLGAGAMGNYAGSLSSIELQGDRGRSGLEKVNSKFNDAATEVEQAWQMLTPAQQEAADHLAKRATYYSRTAAEIRAGARPARSRKQWDARAATSHLVEATRQALKEAPADELETARAVFRAAFFEETADIDGKAVMNPRISYCDAATNEALLALLGGTDKR